MNPLTTLPIRIVVKKNHSDKWTATSSATKTTATSCTQGVGAAANLAKRWFFGQANQVPIEAMEHIHLEPILGYQENNVLCVYQATYKP